MKNKFSCKHKRSVNCFGLPEPCFKDASCYLTEQELNFPCLACIHRGLGEPECNGCINYEKKINFMYNEE